MEDQRYTFKAPTPGTALKWGGVVFAYAIGLLIVISIVLAMFEAY